MICKKNFYQLFFPITETNYSKNKELFFLNKFTIFENKYESECYIVAGLNEQTERASNAIQNKHGKY